MSTIKHIEGLEILDSRGRPTVEACVVLSNDSRGCAAVPSGASTGALEAVELRDSDSKRYAGLGVATAVSHVNTTIASALCGKNFECQKDFDTALIDLDGTKNKSRLGANAILAVSLAYARAQAEQQNQPLVTHLAEKNEMSMPMPMLNVINGGAHANNSLQIQEFMIVPVGASTFPEAMQMSAEIFYQLKTLIERQGHLSSVGDEGGFAPALKSHEQALDLLSNAVDKSGYHLESQVAFALDCASTEYFVNEDGYEITPDSLPLSPEGHSEYLASLCKKYPIVSIEDGMAENDKPGWLLHTEKLGKRLQLVGDDLFCTNKSIFQKGISENLANAILIKLNQIGTLTETLETLTLAKEHSYNTIISHRSGETEDTFISDLAVATNAGQIKTGSMSRSDRVAKYNQLLRINHAFKLPLANPFR